jgi:hypothetical protein
MMSRAALAGSRPGPFFTLGIGTHADEGDGRGG